MILRVILKQAAVTTVALLLALGLATTPAESGEATGKEVVADAIDSFEAFCQEQLFDGVPVCAMHSDAINGVVESTAFVYGEDGVQVLKRIYTVVDEATGARKELPAQEALALMGLN